MPMLDLSAVESSLWKAADNLRTNSNLNANEYSMPVLGLILLRQEPELYISQQAAKAGYRTLVPSSLQRASDLTVANLYWYFRFRNDDNSAASVDECDRPKTA